MITNICCKLKPLFATGLLMTTACTLLDKHQASSDQGTLKHPSINMAGDSLMAVLWMQHSAEYRSLCYQAFNLATERLMAAVQSHESPTNLCVVVDIDETMLDNSVFQAQLIHNGDSYSAEAWQSWSNKAEAAAVPGASEFLKVAKQKKVEVFYISNRRETERIATINNLKKHGFPYADNAHVILRKAKEEGDKIEKDDSKETRRRALQKEIVLFIGDNLADFDNIYDGSGSDTRLGATKIHRELFGRRFIVLPNPVYGDWESALYGSKDMKPIERAVRRREALILK